ncbi:MAG: YgiQ family radical SAM protein, partial [bacterium]
MFLPAAGAEIKALGWERPDVILVSGDTYIDSPYSGIAVIGKYLMSKGFKTAVIAQPDISSGEDIMSLGEPALFWGVSGGSVDSMAANFTASLKRRKLSDDFTPGAVNDRRPDNAVIVYSNLIRKYFKNTVPIVIGGLEASLRRVAHYDYLKDKIKRSILFDAKADYLVYGMGEKSALALARSLKKGGTREETAGKIKGICYISGSPPEGYAVLPSFEEVKTDKDKFTEMFKMFYGAASKGLAQKQDTRYLVQNPAEDYSPEDLDEIYGLDFEREAHPHYLKQGEINAVDTIRTSITTHRGCFGGCNFCAISAHQGKKIISRSEDSITAEAEKIAGKKGFGGIISDVGGPTANMYGMDSEKNHKRLIRLLRRLRGVKGVKKV